MWTYRCIQGLDHADCLFGLHSQLKLYSSDTKKEREMLKLHYIQIKHFIVGKRYVFHFSSRSYFCKTHKTWGNDNPSATCDKDLHLLCENWAQSGI